MSLCCMQLPVKSNAIHSALPLKILLYILCNSRYISEYVYNIRHNVIVEICYIVEKANIYERVFRLYTYIS
ncbi:hypothetical protein XENTR_v10016548 [Xenopus tropicalis]|nr:hypothetical protein XENTR_v10016548 [Xenopus tropicalis]